MSQLLQPAGARSAGLPAFALCLLALCLLPVGGHFAAVLRLARILRLLRVVSAMPRLQFLVAALFKSLGSMGDVGLLLLLLFSLSAVIGVSVFGPGDAENFGSIPVPRRAILGGDGLVLCRRRRRTTSRGR